nr:Arm DNA-binding domain-containing protein [Bradyrhizobium lablabi]
MDTDAKEFWHERAANRKTVWAYLGQRVVIQSSVGNCRKICLWLPRLFAFAVKNTEGDQTAGAGPPPQFRTRNDLDYAQRTQSNPNENAADLTKLIDLLPFITVWLQVRVLPGPPHRWSAGVLSHSSSSAESIFFTILQSLVTFRRPPTFALCSRTSRRFVGIFVGIYSKSKRDTNMTLTDTKCRNAKGQIKPRKLSDGGGLHLLVSPDGAKYWRLAYRWHGKQRTLAIGVYPAIGLMEARAARDEAKRNLAADVDPSVVKQERKRAAKIATDNTFEAIAREWHENWKGARTPYYAAQILRLLEADAFPAIGRRPIAALEPPELLDVLRKKARGERNGAPAQATGRTNIPFRDRDRSSKTGSLRRSQGRTTCHWRTATSQGDAAFRAANVLAEIGALQRRAADQTCIEALNSNVSSNDRAARRQVE